MLRRSAAAAPRAAAVLGRGGAAAARRPPATLYGGAARAASLRHAGALVRDVSSARSIRAASWPARCRSTSSTTRTPPRHRDRHAGGHRRRPRLPGDRVARGVPRPVRAAARQLRRADHGQPRHRTFRRRWTVSRCRTPPGSPRRISVPAAVRSAPGPAFYSTALAADDLAAVLEALGHQRRSNLYGDSYGTYFAQVFALRHPQRLRSLVLDGAYPLDGPDYAWYPHYAPAMREKFNRACERSADCSAIPGSSIEHIAPALEAAAREALRRAGAPGRGQQPCRLHRRCGGSSRSSCSGARRPWPRCARPTRRRAPSSPGTACRCCA